MSPFGSIAMTGMWSSAASSRMPIPSPVLPDPVMPIMTAWVVRSLAVIQDKLFRELVGFRVIALAEVESAKLLEVLHLLPLG